MSYTIHIKVFVSFFFFFKEIKDLANPGLHSNKATVGQSCAAAAFFRWDLLFKFSTIPTMPYCLSTWAKYRLPFITTFVVLFSFKLKGK